MRLIHTKTLEFHEFFSEQVPPYAILSHTWGTEELSLQEFLNPHRNTKKKQGYIKITCTCRLAQQDGLEYAWVDTCCIDKTSSAELTESINSMYQWYQNAKLCYVHLEDMAPGVAPEVGLPRCRWFTRGWTLQELIAPTRLQFWDKSWAYRGTKLDFAEIISASARIPSPLILGTYPLKYYSVAERMSWASHRETTRVEDTAYCLLGLFDVNMPLVYGEGAKAFRRLQEEIVKRRSDLSIFAWNPPADEKSDFLGVLASSPAAFRDCSNVGPFDDDVTTFTVTNTGLFISGEAAPMRIQAVKVEGSDREVVSYLFLLGTDGTSPESSLMRGIYLRKIAPTIFYRDARFPLARFGRDEAMDLKIFNDFTNYYILIDPIIAITVSPSTYRKQAIHVPPSDTFELHEAVPEKLWDFTDRVFLRPNPYSFTRYRTAMAMRFFGHVGGDNSVDFVVLCDFRGDTPLCKLFEYSTYRLQAEMLFRGRYTMESVFWVDLESQQPEFTKLTDRVEVHAGGGAFIVSASFKLGIVESVSKEVELYSLRLSIKRQR